MDIPADLFPLPLTTLEAFMLADARPEYPALCDMEVLFRGRIDRAAFDAGLQSALARSPLFRCVVEQLPRKKPAWVLTDQTPTVDWQSLGEPIANGYNRFVDLTKELSLKVYVRAGDDEARVLFHFHHAVSDGIGGFHFIEDFLAGYAAACPGSPAVKARDVDLSRLKLRGDTATAGRSFYRGLQDTFLGIYAAAKFFWQAPQALASPPKIAAPQQYRPLVGFVPDDVVARLRQKAADGVSVNDLLLRDAFLALHRWEADHGRPADRGYLRVLMPQNLRGRDDRTMPAANVMAFAFLTRAAKLCRQPEKLLASLQEETEAIRKGQLSRYFLGGLSALYDAGALPRLLQGNLCFSTLVLSNLSDPTRRFITRFPRTEYGLQIGDLTLTGIEAVPHVRPNTRAVFVLITRGEKLSVCARIDPNYFTPEEGQKLLDVYLKQISETAGT